MIRFYVDPGPGFVFSQNGLVLWGFLLGIAGGFMFFLKFFFRFVKKWFWVLLALALLAAFVTWGVRMRGNKVFPKVVVIGIDGMDPAVAEKLMDEGRLPNFARLRETGSYGRLATTLPSESAVAWTSFYTGRDPGNHGIFDFVMRDPRTYAPYLSLNEITNAGGRTSVHLRGEGIPFWETLSSRKVPCNVFFCPNTFPPGRLRGVMVSGMGVPDITGTMGRPTFYSTKGFSPGAESRIRVVNIVLENGGCDTSLYGPKVARDGKTMEARSPLRIRRVDGRDAVRIKTQRDEFILEKSAWSGWKTVDFSVGLFKTIKGMVMFHCVRVRPELELYASPVNFDPRAPMFAVSYPAGFSRSLAKKIGLYHTQGMPHDTWGFSEGILDEDAFLGMADAILEGRKRILRETLEGFSQGFFFFYLDTLDAVQHMFWRYRDPGHPLFADGSAYSETIEKYYRALDAVIGDVLKAAGDDALVMVISDHGFCGYRRSFDLNRWLIENGYLTLRASRKGQAVGFLEDIDWTKTQAYALGFGGIYLNKEDREGRGIVRLEEERELIQAIRSGLEAFVDPLTGQRPVSAVYEGDLVFRGRCRERAPDLFVGFNEGYRVSWQTALGGAGTTVVRDNDRKWSGDHLVDPRIVPGVIFVNRKADLSGASIVDCAASVLAAFGCEAQGMDGRDLLAGEKE